MPSALSRTPVRTAIRPVPATGRPSPVTQVCVAMQCGCATRWLCTRRTGGGNCVRAAGEGLRWHGRRGRRGGLCARLRATALVTERLETCAPHCGGHGQTTHQGCLRRVHTVDAVAGTHGSTPRNTDAPGTWLKDRRREVSREEAHAFCSTSGFTGAGVKI